jgi:hypothetical protein
MIPKTVCERLNNPQTDKSETATYTEYQPNIIPETEAELRTACEITSSVYNMFGENYINDEEYVSDTTTHDFYNQFVRVYTIGQLRKIYHILCVKYNFPTNLTRDFSEVTRPDQEISINKRKALVVYEIAALILNHYDFVKKSYDKNDVINTITEIKNCVWYKDIETFLSIDQAGLLQTIIHTYMPDINF